MDDEREEAEGWVPRQIAWAVRAAFFVAALFGTLWLFFGYQPPRKEPLAPAGGAEGPRAPREKVVFWHMWTSNWAKVVQDIVDRFNASQELYEVEALTVIGGSLKTLTATAGGDPPDCMAQWEPVIPAWAERGALEPLDELMKPAEWAALRDRMYPAVREIGMYHGHFYGLSTGMNIWAIYYRPSHFREAGLDPGQFPQTLEELDAVSDKLFQYDRAGRITRIGFMPRWLLQWSAVFGGTFYDEQTREPVFTDARTVAALEYLTARARKYGFERVMQFESGLTTTMAASWPFISGAYSIVVDGQWRVEQLAKYAPEMDYLTAPIPPPAGGKARACWSNGNFMIIPRGAKNKQGALAFMKFWSGVDDPQRAAEFYTWGGWLPITPDVANAPLYQEYCRKYPQFRTFVEIMSSPNVQVSPPVPVQAFMMQRLGTAEDSALRESLTPRQALERLAAETQRELENLRAARTP